MSVSTATILKQNVLTHSPDSMYHPGAEASQMRAFLGMQQISGTGVARTGTLRQLIKNTDLNPSGSHTAAVDGPSWCYETAAPAASDSFTLRLQFMNDASTEGGEAWTAVGLQAVSAGVTDGSEEGRLVLQTMQAGTLTESLRMDANGLRIPDDTTLAFGASSDGTIEYDEDGTDQLRIGGVSAVFTLGAQVDAVARTATADGTGTGTIADGTSFVTVTSASANNIIVLPTPKPGEVVWLMNGGTGYELRSSTPASVAINGGTGASAESAVGANVLVRAICTTATTWVCNTYSTIGTEAALEAAA